MKPRSASFLGERRSEHMVDVNLLAYLFARVTEALDVGIDLLQKVTGTIRQLLWHFLSILAR